MKLNDTSIKVVNPASPKIFRQVNDLIKNNVKKENIKDWEQQLVYDIIQAKHKIPIFLNIRDSQKVVASSIIQDIKWIFNNKLYRYSKDSFLSKYIVKSTKLKFNNGDLSHTEDLSIIQHFLENYTEDILLFGTHTEHILKHLQEVLILLHDLHKFKCLDNVFIVNLDDYDKSTLSTELLGKCGFMDSRFLHTHEYLNHSTKDFQPLVLDYLQQVNSRSSIGRTVASYQLLVDIIIKNYSNYKYNYDRLNSFTKPLIL